MTVLHVVLLQKSLNVGFLRWKNVGFALWNLNAKCEVQFLVLFDAAPVLNLLDDVFAELIFVATADDEVVNVHTEDHVTFLVFQNVHTWIADGSLES